MDGRGVGAADQDAHALAWRRHVRPLSSAASAAAPPGSATRRKPDHSARCASRIAASSTSTTRLTYARASENISVPTRFGASEKILACTPRHMAA
jgi:hypothetical protein